jgi:hypothetical protein
LPLRTKCHWSTSCRSILSNCPPKAVGSRPLDKLAQVSKRTTIPSFHSPNCGNPSPCAPRGRLIIPVELGGIRHRYPRACVRLLHCLHREQKLVDCLPLLDRKRGVSAYASQRVHLAGEFFRALRTRQASALPAHGRTIAAAARALPCLAVPRVIVPNMSVHAHCYPPGAS